MLIPNERNFKHVIIIPKKKTLNKYWTKTSFCDKGSVDSTIYHSLPIGGAINACQIYTSYQLTLNENTAFSAFLYKET